MAGILGGSVNAGAFGRVARSGSEAVVAVTALVWLLASCTGGDGRSSSPSKPTQQSASLHAQSVLAGAAHESIVPTVGGERAFLSKAVGWPSAESLDPINPGVFVPAWDQGTIDVGNGLPDSAWVHDDLQVTALALQRGEERVLIVTTDTYMHFATDADEVAKVARASLPAEWSTAAVEVVATHNHHGPDTAFSVNKEWYQLLADQAAVAATRAVDRLEPVTLRVATGEHRFGVNDVRDPVILDTRLNVLALDALDNGDAVATVVQWASHPETTLNWVPPLAQDELNKACAAKNWQGEDCTPEGRYLTADYPGVLRERLASSRGGEVMYLNGALGSQVGPGDAPVWTVDADHPVGDGWTPPEGAAPVSGCAESVDLTCRSFAKTEAIGTQLALAVRQLLTTASEVEVEGLRFRQEEFFVQLTNLGFRVLISDRTLGWQEPQVYTCQGPPSPSACSLDGGERESDPVVTPLADSEISVGDFVKTRLGHLDLGPVGMLFLPGELPPELVVGLPADFDSHPERYYRDPDEHAVGADYQFPGYLLSLVDEEVTFTVGLGGDELGYFVPVADYRLKCVDLALPAGSSCADLASAGEIDGPDWLAGSRCLAPQLPEPGSAVAAICRYGQALGRELGEPSGHYEETNSAGWTMVDDLWAAATRLFGSAGSGRVNPGLVKVNSLS